jgi:hypothetical protein
MISGASEQALIQGAQLAAAVSVEAAMGARRIASRQRRLRAPLVAIDHIVDGLELRNLAGRTSLDDRICEELDQLSTLVPLTDEVTHAVDTSSLHAALLDLQEELYRRQNLASGGDRDVGPEKDQRPEQDRQQRREHGAESSQVGEVVVIGGHEHADHQPYDRKQGY